MTEQLKLEDLEYSNEESDVLKDSELPNPQNYLKRLDKISRRVCDYLNRINSNEIRIEFKDNTSLIESTIEDLDYTEKYNPSEWSQKKEDEKIKLVQIGIGHYNYINEARSRRKKRDAKKFQIFDVESFKKEKNSLRSEVINLVLQKKEDEMTEKITCFIKSQNKLYSTNDDIKSEVWFYDDGIYKPNGKSKVKEITREILGVAYTPQRVNKILAKIEADTFIDLDDFFEHKHKKEIPVLNGILNLETKELSEFTPEKIFFNKLPIKYDKTADCPKIENFFKDILRNEQDIDVMYEFFGYCLWKEHFIEKAIMMLGEGRNGKGKTLNLLKLFLGAENCCNIPIKEMQSNSFRMCEFFGKLANIAGDLDNYALKDTGLFKQITARDMISAKRKFLNDISFINYSKQIFACNELPKVYDMSKGFWSRWILLEFPYEFISREEYNKTLSENLYSVSYKRVRDEDIVSKISTQGEMSGLLNKSLEGLSRLFKNRDFSYTKGTAETKEMWIRKSNSFVAFCMDCIEEEADKSINKVDLRKEFGKYCKKHNLKGCSDKEIKITLETLFGVVDRQLSYGAGYTWDGIKLSTGIKD